MARADLLLKLVAAGSKGDQALFRQAAEAIISEERRKHHSVLADRLTACLSEKNAVQQISTRFEPEAREFFHVSTPRRRLADIFLPEPVSAAARELVEEQQRADLLRSYNMDPRHRILLTGPPGNGKTSFAEALAYEMALPLLTVRYERVIGSYLGETAVRIGKLFDFVRTRLEAVLFFDEFDAIAKERGDPHDTGEVKRIVSSLLLEIDSLPAYVVVVTATNHPELLDRAVWRRFQVRMSLELPVAKQRAEFLREKLGEHVATPYLTVTGLSQDLAGISFAELEEFSSDVRRQIILSAQPVDICSVVRSRVAQWKNEESDVGENRSWVRWRWLIGQSFTFPRRDVKHDRNEVAGVAVKVSVSLILRGSASVSARE